MNIKLINTLKEINKSVLLLPFTEENFLSKSILGAKRYNEIKKIIDLYGKNFPEIFNINIGKEFIILYKLKPEETNEFYLLKKGKKLADFIKKYKFESITIIPPEYIIKNINKEITKCILEGVLFGFYEFYKFKTKRKDFNVKSINIFAGNNKLKKKLNELEKILPIIFKNLNLYRNLVNMPPAELTPKKFTEKIKELSNEKLSIKILDEKDILKNNFNLIYTVGNGSKNRPYYVKLVYKGNTKSEKHIALVGKGVTFDSGGTNLKPSGHIETMKMDMAGAALMLTLTLLISELKLPVNIHTYLPLVENILGDNSYKPGDIIKSASGKTIEILNTDAEGRLILADALFDAASSNPDLIIDAATLTGACIVALGGFCAGFFTHDEIMAKKLVKSSDKTAENIWQLPLLDIYKYRLEAQNADLCNIAKQKGEAGSTMAAMFLQEFICNRKWIHLDIAGPAYVNENHPFYGSGATGFGLRLLLDFIKNYS